MAEALRRIISEYQLRDQAEDITFYEESKAIIDEIIAHEESVRCTSDGNSYETERKNENAKVVAFFFETQASISTDKTKHGSLNFEDLVSAHKEVIREYLFNLLLTGDDLSQNTQVNKSFDICSDYLVQVDSSFSNKFLFPNVIYLHDELEDRVAAFPIALNYLRKVIETFSKAKQI